jgi:D-beta-D-heptose 7-phosphate kinase/D-beta-D-heptose 1-phosphate adenosyltransferase
VSTDCWELFLENFVDTRVLVTGDVMLDEYIWGEAVRLCPEAPVPVVQTRRRTVRPGGAANAAANLAAFGARPMLAGVVGDDRAADSLRGALREAGVEAGGLFTDAERPTTTKMRVLAQNQQILRLDGEVTTPLPAELTTRLGDWAERCLGGCSACLLCDYGKGALGGNLIPRLIGAARRLGRPVVVDPKGTDYHRYQGATVIKPNLRELGEALGRPVPDGAALRVAGARLARELPGTAVLVTRGSDGMALFRDGQPPAFLPAAPARGVYDVTGAGDTVVAVLALALAGGASLDRAVTLANVAAGVAVGKTGTAVVTLAELRAALAAGIPELSV